MKRPGHWLATLALFGALQVSAAVDTRVDFFLDGYLLDRALVVGDPGKWISVVEGHKGKSVAGKVRIEPTVAADGMPALRVDFSHSNMQGQVALYGKSLDFSALRDTHALRVDMRLLSRPGGAIALGMECGWPCRSETSIEQHLGDAPLKQWFTLSLALDCFAGSEFDLGKVNAGFMLISKGHFQMELGDIRLEPAPRDTHRCGRP